MEANESVGGPLAVHAGSEVPWTAEQPQRREWSETRTNFGDKVNRSC